MALDFDEIRDLTKQKIREREEREHDATLTEQQKKDVEFFVNEMENYVNSYANVGKQSFLYDCSRLEKKVFRALADAFKAQNPHFFVMTKSGCQELTVDWSGKHEV